MFIYMKMLLVLTYHDAGVPIKVFETNHDPFEMHDVVAQHKPGGKLLKSVHQTLYYKLKGSLGIEQVQNPTLSETNGLETDVQDEGEAEMDAVMLPTDDDTDEQ